MGRVRCRFLRLVVEIIHHETSGVALPRLREGLPPHLCSLLREVLASSSATREASVELEPGLDLLLSIDRVLCGGSGVVTTRATAALASRVLSRSTGLTVPGDVVATLQHLRAPFEQPFIDVPLHFAARRSPDGFSLDLHIPREQRAARWLASAGLGYAQAAARFSGEETPRLRLHADVVGDVARVLGRSAETGLSVPAPAAGRDDRSRPLPRRSSRTNAAARVDQILSRSTPKFEAARHEAEAAQAKRPSTLPDGAASTAHASGTRPTPEAPPSRARRSAS